MKRNKMIGMAVLTAMALGVTAIAGCGSGSSYSSSEVTYTYDAGNYDGDVGYDATGEYADEAGAEAIDGYTDDTSEEYTDIADYESEVTEDGMLGETLSDETTTEQKLIVTWNLNMETEKYDDAISEVQTSVKECGGYIEGEDASSYYDCNRDTFFTIRIPNEKAEEWIAGTSEFGTITSRSKSTVDATLEYVDTESRLKALRTEEETLMGMMEQADEVSDLITIQKELSSVNAEIESYESQLRVLDNQVNYTTIYLEIMEVDRESAEPQTLGQEIKETFLNSTDNLRNFGRGLLVGILGHIITIVIVIAIIAAIVLVSKKIRVNRKDKAPEKSGKGRRLRRKETLKKDENPNTDDNPEK